MSADRVLEKIRAAYARAIGPMAHVLVDEMLAADGAPPEAFPPNKLPELVEKLSWKIHSERRRVEFQAAALQVLQPLQEQE